MNFTRLKLILAVTTIDLNEKDSNSSPHRTGNPF
jgi:hypothetical protein